MTSSGDTRVMIRNLAHDAGMKPSGAFSFDTALLLGAASSFIAALLVLILMLAMLGIHPDLVTTLGSAPFRHKVSSMLTVACAGLLLVRYVGRPGTRGPALIAVLPGLTLLIIGAISDASGLPVIGRSAISAPICLAAIVCLSLLPLAITLYVLKMGVPTRPAVAGAAAGVLAGTIGATVYSLVCKNDGGMFIAVWYSLAILIVVGLGAIVGRRVLAW